MTGQDIVIVLGAINTLIITLAAVFAKRADAKASRAIVVAAQGVEVSQRNAAALEHVKTQTDGMSDKLAKVSFRAGEAHGLASGLQQSHELGEAKLAQGTAEGTAVGLQQGRDEAKPP
jgi:hypothetical protein